MSSFTYGDLDRLYTNIGVVDEELLSYVKNNKSGMPIKLEDWNEIFGIKLCWIILCSKEQTKQ